RVITIGPYRFEPGVWRFAVFGALLVVTLRLAPDGFLAPLVARLGRAGRRARAVSAAPAVAPREGASALPGRHPAARHGHAQERRGVDLRIERVSMHFGGFVALDAVDLVVDRPQICGVIGPNGAGKTTLVNIVSGYYEPTGGAVILGGERVD